MKPTRGQMEPSWLRIWTTMPRQRRVSVLSLFALIMMLCMLVFYRRLEANPAPNLNMPEPPADTLSTDTGATAPGEGARETPVQESEQVPATAAPVPKRLQMPVPGEVAAGYTPVWSEALGDWRWHTGLDLRAPAGAEVKAAAEGEVLTVEEDPLFGLTVAIDHRNGLVTRYSGLEGPVVEPGDKVAAGQLIARVGAPGPAEAGSGHHLHFEVLEEGEPADPRTFLR